MRLSELFNLFLKGFTVSLSGLELGLQFFNLGLIGSKFLKLTLKLGDRRLVLSLSFCEVFLTVLLQGFNLTLQCRRLGLDFLQFIRQLLTLLIEIVHRRF